MSKKDLQVEILHHTEIKLYLLYSFVTWNFISLYSSRLFSGKLKRILWKGYLYKGFIPFPQTHTLFPQMSLESIWECSESTENSNARLVPAPWGSRVGTQRHQAFPPGLSTWRLPIYFSDLSSVLLTEIDLSRTVFQVQAEAVFPSTSNNTQGALQLHRDRWVSVQTFLAWE